MRVTTCELPDETSAFERAFAALAAHCQEQKSELVLLPELPFHPWFGVTRTFEERTWRAAEEAHRIGLERLSQLAPAAVLATAPVTRGGRRLNEGFVWDEKAGYRAAHHKFYLPNEEGVWEGNWYERGSGGFEVVEVGAARIGFLICSEMWALERARAYGRAGAHLVVIPRLTGRATVDKWLAGGRTAAVVSGAYSLSSNRSSETQDYGGAGWTVDPDGQVLATTTAARPFVTVGIDLAAADRAKFSYPRYLID